MEPINDINMNKCSILKISHLVSIAPMMDVTTNHFRTLVRLLTKEATLYTEMIHHDTVLNSKRGTAKELYFPLDHKPIVLQLGGNDPEILEKIAPFCKEAGYDEINLNCGCPSSKVMTNNFGAILMKDPELVARCTEKLSKITQLETTIKCRLGLDKDNKEFLTNFIKIVSEKGNVKHFTIHARLALMGLDTDKNRKIPPLQYDKVYKLKEEFPDLEFSINGGIKTIEEIKLFLKGGELNGCMIGRIAYDNPWMLREIDKEIYGKDNPGLSRKQIVYKYADYCETLSGEDVHYNNLIKPLTNLFAYERQNIIFKNLLYDYKKVKKERNLSEYIKYVVDEYEKINEFAVNQI